MSRTSTTLALAMATLLAMTGFVLLLIVALLQPPTGDLVALATFLSLSGGATVLLALAATRLGLPRWVRSLWARMVLVSALTAVLALVNVGFTSVLMFLSTHNLALLAGCWASHWGWPSSSPLPSRSRPHAPCKDWQRRSGA